MEFFGGAVSPLRLTTYEKGVIVTIESRDEDGKLIRVVGMETENPSVAESTAKNPRERQMSFPFISSDKSKPMTLLRGNRLDPSKSASVDLILRRSTGASFFDEIVYGNERMLAEYRERIKMLLAENLKETKELQPI